MQNTAGPPLPPGWEARWDRNQGAYFFIDHNTKKTTWIDPRISMQQQTPQQQYGGQHAAAAQLLSQSSSKSPTMQDIPLDALTRVDNRNHPHFGQERELTTAFSVKHPPPDTTNAHLEATINSLVKTHPGASHNIVKDVLMSCNNDISTAKEALESMGYMQQTEGSTSSGTHINRLSTSKQTNQRSPSREVTRSSPAKETMSEEEKRKVKLRVIEAFSNLEENVIDMALNICHHNEAKCSALLRSWNEKKTSETSPRSRSSESESSESLHTSPILSMSPEPVSMDMDEGMPVSFPPDPADEMSLTADMEMMPGEEFGSLESSSTSATGDESIQEFHEEEPQEFPEEAPEEIQQEEPEETPQETNEETPQEAPEEPTEDLIPRDPLQRSGYRTTAIGPNPELRRGPDQSLLMRDNMVAIGPNPELQQGPDPSRLGERAVAQGPNPDLVHGPMCLPTSRRLLVTSI